MQLWVVMIQDTCETTVDRVLLYAAEERGEAEAMARDFYRAEKRPIARYRFWGQPIKEVTGPHSTLYGIGLHPLVEPKS